MIISWIVEFSKSVEVTKAQSLPLDKLTITQTYYSIHHGPLLIPVNSIARCLSLGKNMQNNVMLRQKGQFMAFKFINQRYCDDANEGFGQSSTSSTSLQDIT